MSVANGLFSPNDSTQRQGVTGPGIAAQPQNLGTAQSMTFQASEKIILNQRSANAAEPIIEFMPDFTGKLIFEHDLCEDRAPARFQDACDFLHDRVFVG
jgi:hypothetical protein